MVRGEVLDVPAQAVIDLEHDEAHAYRVDHLLRHESSISHPALLESPLFLPWQRGIGGRIPHLRKTNHCIVPAEIVRDPYPRHQPQTHKDGRGTKDRPVDTDEHGTEIPVTRRGNYLWFVHCSGRTDLTNTATCVRPVRAASVQSSLGRWCRSVAVVFTGSGSQRSRTITGAAMGVQEVGKNAEMQGLEVGLVDWSGATASTKLGFTGIDELRKHHPTMSIFRRRDLLRAFDNPSSLLVSLFRFQ